MSLIRSMLLAASIGASPMLATAAIAQQAAPAPAGITAAQATKSMRDLWVDHIFWVRNVVVETLSHNQAAAAVAEAEVVADAHRIAAAIEPFYGKQASDKLFTLLAGHYGAIKQYLQAGTNQTAKNTAMKAGLTNADQIAVFLAGANPNLPVETLKALLDAHISQHAEQIDQLRAKQYSAEAKTWEMMKSHIYIIADALTGALVKQFPHKFV